MQNPSPARPRVHSGFLGDLDTVFFACQRLGRRFAFWRAKSDNQNSVLIYSGQDDRKAA